MQDKNVCSDMCHGCDTQCAVCNTVLLFQMLYYSCIVLHCLMLWSERSTMHVRQ